MLPKLEHHPVNWVDGMKITRQHFSDFEHFVSDHLRDASAAGLASYRYGLLPSNLPDFNLQVIIDQSQNLRLRLSNCRAVTGAGCRIELVEEPVELSTNLAEIMARYNLVNTDELHFLIVLAIDLFARKPVGEPSPRESFPRPPFTQPGYQLSVVPRHQYDGQPGTPPGYKSAEFESFHLIVGQLTCKFGQLHNDESYIPASATLNAHVRLRTWADATYKLLAETQRDALLIVNKVCEKRGTEQARKAGPLAELIRMLCERLAEGLDEPLNQFRFTAPEQAPVFWIQAITLATRRLKTAINCLNDTALSGSVRMGRDLTLKYFQDWTSITPDQLMVRDIEQVINHGYDHSNLYPHLLALTRCWEDIYKIVNQLSQLEYIGQQPQNKQIRYDSVVTSPSDLPPNPLDAPTVVGGTFRPRMTGR